MKFENLTEDNFIMYAMRHYENPGCFSREEFQDDLAKIKYIKRLFRRYKGKKSIESLKTRLVLNHIIVVYNVFPGEVGTRILFQKLEKDLWPILKSFLLFLHRCPEMVPGINNDDILMANIKVDKKVQEELKTI
jgi:hypothetical protein